MGHFSVLSYGRSQDNFQIAVVAVLLAVILENADGLRVCYQCNTTTSGLDCLRNPSNVTDGEIKCKGYCTIMRKDYVTMPEDYSLISLQRSCEINPVVLDAVVVEGYFKIYFRSCKSYLCNVGLGIQSLRDIPEDPAWDLYTDEEEANAASPKILRYHQNQRFIFILISLSSFMLLFTTFPIVI